MIELVKGLPDNVLAVNCRGQIHTEDYECTLIPALEQKLAHHDKLRLFYRAGQDFKGIDPGAILEDSKVGLAHLSRWEKMAVVTDIEWIRLAIRAFAFLMPCPVKFFSVVQEDEARRWIAA
jgi:SpoIIAA-like